MTLGTLPLLVEITARTPDGPALEITMIDQGFTSDTSEFLTEIQVPLKPY